jgi:hypothetical protein
MRPPRTTGPGAPGDDGVALLAALLALTLLHAVGIGLVMVSTTDYLVARSRRASVEARYAASAMLERAIGDLESLPDWSPALAGLTRSAFLDGTTRPTLPSGVVVDLDAVTATLQSESDASSRRGADNPRWTLFASGPLPRLAGSPVAAGASYLAAWVADDLTEFDGLPSVDANRTISVRAVAFGPDTARAEAAATLAVVDDGAGGTSVRVLSWREIR